MPCPAEACGEGGALSLLMKSNADMGKKIKTWSVSNLVIMALAGAAALPAAPIPHAGRVTCASLQDEVIILIHLRLYSLNT